MNENVKNFSINVEMENGKVTKFENDGLDNLKSEDIEKAFQDSNTKSQTITELKSEIKKIKEDCREAINTTWRFINAYEKKNDCPIKGALKSAKFHLEQANYIFDEETKEN